MTIEERLARLEKQNRRLKWALSGLVGVAIAGSVMGLKLATDDLLRPPFAGPRVIQAERIEVIDAVGGIVAAIAPNGNGGGVVYTNNSKGKLVAQMGAADDGRGVIWTYDNQGVLRPDIR